MSGMFFLLDSELTDKADRADETSRGPRPIRLVLVGRGEDGARHVLHRTLTSLAVRFLMADGAGTGDLLKELRQRVPLPEHTSLEVEQLAPRTLYYGHGPPRVVIDVKVKTLGAFRAIRRVCKEALATKPLTSARPCEVSLPETTRPLLEQGVTHGIWLDARGHPRASAGSKRPPNLSIGSYDIECYAPLPPGGESRPFANASNPEHRVVSIALVHRPFGAGGDEHSYFLYVGPPGVTYGNTTSKQYNREEDLLLAFAELLRQLDPDVLLSYNGDRFDAPFLEARIRLLLGAANDGAAGSAWWWSPLSTRPPRHEHRSEEDEQRDAESRKQGRPVVLKTTFEGCGLANWDVLDFAKTLSLESNTLGDVSSHVLGHTKADLTIEKMMSITESNNLEDWGKIAEYNIIDARLPIDILNKKGQFAFALQLCRVTGCSLAQICAGGQQKRLLSAVYAEIFERRMVLNEPSQLDFREHPHLSGYGLKVKGATVLDTQPGWYREPVVGVDYSSLYPSVITSRNLCPSMLLIDQRAEPPPEERAQWRQFAVEELDGSKVRYWVKQRSGPDADEGVFPAVIQRLLDQRALAKREKKTLEKSDPDYASRLGVLSANEQALKVLANSAYGGLNAILKGSLYCRPLGSIVTSEGRAAIEQIRGAVERIPEAVTIAGDTDSCMVLLKGRTLKEAEAIGMELAATVTATLRANGMSTMTLVYEKALFPSVFLKRKSYSFLCHKPGERPEPVSMGVLSKKRGTSQFLREAYARIEQLYLLSPERFSEDDVRKAQLLVMHDLMVRLPKLPVSAFQKTCLIKAENEYSADQSLPHVNATRRWVEQQGAAWPTNTRIAYVQRMPPPAPAGSRSKFRASDHSILVRHAAERDIKIKVDLYYYIKNVHNRFTDLLELVEFSLGTTTAKRRFDAWLASIEREDAGRRPAGATICSAFERSAGAEDTDDRSEADIVLPAGTEEDDWRGVLDTAVIPSDSPFALDPPKDRGSTTLKRGRRDPEVQSNKLNFLPLAAPTAAGAPSESNAAAVAKSSAAAKRAADAALAAEAARSIKNANVEAMFAHGAEWKSVVGAKVSGTPNKRLKSVRASPWSRS